MTRWINATDENLLYLSVLTFGEIRKGIASLPDVSSRRVSLESWLDHELALRFAGRILAIDQAVADRWGEITAKALAAKSPLPVIDGLLAATALQHNLPSGHPQHEGCRCYGRRSLQSHGHREPSSPLNPFPSVSSQ